ncbi:MAG: hypothetical protein DDT35_00835 [Firmicutes bacterium]|nr:hypothetical protein [Bacillota bacterium]
MRPSLVYRQRGVSIHNCLDYLFHNALQPYCKNIQLGVKEQAQEPRQWTSKVFAIDL